MRDYKGTKAGLIVVNRAKPENTIRHLKVQVDALIRQADNNKNERRIRAMRRDQRPLHSA